MVPRPTERPLQQKQLSPIVRVAVRRHDASPAIHSPWLGSGGLTPIRVPNRFADDRALCVDEPQPRGQRTLDWEPRCARTGGPEKGLPANLPRVVASSVDIYRLAERVGHLEIRPARAVRDFLRGRRVSAASTGTRNRGQEPEHDDSKGTARGQHVPPRRAIPPRFQTSTRSTTLLNSGACVTDRCGGGIDSMNA